MATVASSPLVVYALSKRVSAQVHVLQRLLSLGNEHPDRPGFTIDDVIKWPVFKKRGTPRKSVGKALDRFIDLAIVFSPGSNGPGKRLYRVKNPEWAMAYIAGDNEGPWQPVTPTPSSDQFCDFDEHREHLDVRLTRKWFERIKERCEVNNNQYTLRTKAFTLSLNGKSYAGQIFTRHYWRSEVKHQIGEDFYQYLADKELKEGLQGDFCLPIGVMGQRFTIGGRSTQFSASHYPAQLDIRRSKNDSHIIDGLAALVNQADFYTRVLDSQDAIRKVLEKQGVMLQNVFRIIFPESEQSYQSSSQDRGDVAYR